MAEPAQNQTKIYPCDEEDKKYEKEIVDAIKKLPIEQRFQAIALNNYVLMRKQLDVTLEGQIQEIVKKYNALQAPLMKASNEIVSGKRAPTDEEIQAGREHLTAEEVEKVAESLTAEAIPEYWFKVLSACVKLAEDIHEPDHPLLKQITSIENIPEEGENFTIRFHFNPNEYFENEHLSVKFIMIDENEVAKTEGTEIKWKEGKDITKKTVTKKQKNKKTGKSRTITKTVDADSFFNFFKSIDGKEGGDDEEDEEAEDMGNEQLNINHDIAMTLQEEILSYHLEYYLGLRTGLEGEDEGLEGIDEEDEDDEDDDDEEEGGHKHSKKCKHPKPTAKGDKKEGDTKGGEKQECKQQ